MGIGKGEGLENGEGLRRENEGKVNGGRMGVGLRVGERKGGR